MKDSFYFPHDVNAQDDEKIWKLLKNYGWEGYGLYWALIERLHMAGGWMQLDCDRIAFALRTECVRIQSIIHEHDLFIIEGDKFSSKRVLNNIQRREDKKMKMIENAKKRWMGDAKAMPLLCKSNAIKGKERKENNKPPNPLKGGDRTLCDVVCESPETQFETFYKAYPKKVNPDRALKVWLKKKPPLDLVLTAIEAQKKSTDWTKDEGQFIPHPATWLNSGAWKNQIEESKPEPKLKSLAEVL